MVLDPAQRRVRIIDDEQSLRTAREFDCGLPDVYREALEIGICPHRYLRNQEVLSLQEQHRLADSRVAVIGAGGLGGHVILLLARLGVGGLVVVDHDVFDATNLNRQALSATTALGKAKAEVAASQLMDINPGVRVTAHRARVTDASAEEILAGTDAAVDALDNIRDRFVLQAATGRLGIPLVHGAIAGFEGQLMTIFPGDPGLKAVYGDQAVRGKDPRSPEALLGVPTITPAFVAALQAMEVLKILLKRGELFRHTLVHLDLERGELDRLAFEGPDSSNKP
jgi:molybdopterin/thiamine biosynthesis adenylyltransferase